MSATVETTEENGQYRAHDRETGATGTGATRATALAVLAARLGAEEELADTDLETELRALTEQTRHRFEEENVSEDDVTEAVEWDRSE
jgi:hypothetical protein